MDKRMTPVDKQAGKQKLDIDKAEQNDFFEVSASSPNFTTELASQLAELVPEAITDGKLDMEKLRELLGDDADHESERFGLFWPGKKRALRAAQAPTTATLKPDFANSKNWETTQNVFIEGDNLEVLKILQKHYHNKVKFVYIDPPYNTGKDFVYPDNYKEGLGTYLEWTRQVNEEGKKVSTNSETEGRYHSNWLNMMYPRLKLARNLLTDDGVIFISIDDNEQDNLKKLCHEVFGEGNFVATIVWQKKYAATNDAKGFSTTHDYVVAYQRGDSFNRNLLPRTEKQNKPYKNDDGDGKGLWRSDNLLVKSFSSSGVYPITNPKTGEKFMPPEGSCWRASKETMQTWLAENRIYFGKDGTGAPQLKRYLNEVQQGRVPITWWPFEEVGHNDAANKEIRALFGAKAPFDTPKPVSLIKQMLMIATNTDSIILDFFAGSSTTAHAVTQLNAEDNGKRRFIMVQLPEPTPVDSEARKAGFKTIADISRERVRLAGEKIKTDSPMTVEELDVGFRAYQLADTNFAKWQVSSDVTEDKLQQHLLDLRNINDVVTGSEQSILTEILLKIGFSLTVSITQKQINELTVFDVDTGAVLAYLDKHYKPTLEQLCELVDTLPARFIVLEDIFHGDDELKTNLVQYAKTKRVELWIA